MKGRNKHYKFDKSGGFMSLSLIDKAIILMVPLGNVEVAGEKYPIIYRQFPIHITQVNTTKEVRVEHLNFSTPLPPLEPSICTMAPHPIGLDIDSHPYYSYFLTQRLPIVLHPPSENNFICSDTEMVILYALPETEIQCAAGNKSQYGLYMATAQARAQRFFDAGIGMPVPVLGALHCPFMECMVLQLTDLEHYRSLLRSPQRKDALLDNIAQATENVRQVDAILRVLWWVALDLCAFIGAIELPSWDPSPELAGMVLYSHKFPEYGNVQLAEIATLECWGVPIWIAEQSEECWRLELDASSRPSSDHSDLEEMHQQKLSLMCATKVRVKDAAVYEGKNVVQCAACTLRLFDDDEEELDPLILWALMPSPGEEGIAFDDFTYRLEQKTFVVGLVAWSNQQYKAGEHGDVEGRAWRHRHYYLFNTRNAPTLFAQRSVCYRCPHIGM